MHAGRRVAARARGWVVTFAGFGINLALGALYSWSVFARSRLSGEWGWKRRAGEPSVLGRGRDVRAGDRVRGAGAGPDRAAARGDDGEGVLVGVG